MTITPFTRVNDSEYQRGFTGLLARPLVAPWTHPDLFVLVNHHHDRLETWCRRLGYRLVRLDDCYRLRRVPLTCHDSDQTPLGEAPPRRLLVLTALIAAVLEEQRHDSVTLQDVSDAVRRFSVTNEFRPYDPEIAVQRRELVRAVHHLMELGVLEQRTRSGELEDRWQREGTGIGAGYVIHRDALIGLMDARDADIVLSPDSPPDMDAEQATRGQRLLRTLVETQSLEPARLGADDQTYLRSQRHRLINQAEEMTGGTVEVRSDAWCLILPTDQGLDPALLVDFPKPAAADWVALAMLSQATTQANRTPGRRHLGDAEVAAIATTIYQSHRSRLPATLKESVDSMRRAAEQRLVASGLLILADGGWTLPPAAARYRDAALDESSRGPSDHPTPTSITTPTLFEEEP